ncbi:MAG TPA: hypothetical protein VII47_12355 [Actinomycetota bacterium]
MTSPSAEVTLADDEACFAALARPSVLGGEGTLYTLREDGAIVALRAPQTVEGNSFRALHEPGAPPWLATADSVYLVLGSTASPRKHLVRPIPHFLFGRGRLPDYPLAFTIRGEGGDYLAWNGPAGLGFFKLHGEGVEAVDLRLPVVGLCGWEHEGRLYLAGMTPRRLWEDEEHFDIRFGRGVMVAVDVLGHRFDVKDEAPEVDPTIGRALSERDPTAFPARRMRSSKVRVEAWQAASPAADHVLLLGGILDASPGEEDLWRTALPGYDDYGVLGVYARHAGKSELLDVVVGHGFVGTLPAPEGERLYLVHRSQEPGLRVADLRWSRLDDCRLAPPAPVVVEGIPGETPLARWTPRHDRRVGYYGLLSALRKYARLDEYLMRSDDGVRWEITAQVATAAAGD